jgi:hypothetical protein
MNWYKPLLKKTKPNKYGAEKIEHKGRSFASRAESILFDALMLEKKAGLWSEVHCQVSVYLTKAKILYKPDFLCIDPNGSKTYFEMKGHETASWRIKRRLFMHYGDAPLQVWMYDYKRKELIHKETINPKKLTLE